MKQLKLLNALNMGASSGEISAAEVEVDEIKASSREEGSTEEMVGANYWEKFA